MKEGFKKLEQVLEQVGPQVLAYTVPGVGPVLSGILVHGIAVAHAAQKPDGTKLTGAERLALAVQEAQTAVKGVNAVKPGTIDESLFNDALMKGIGATYDAVNLIHKAQPAAA